MSLHRLLHSTLLGAVVTSFAACGISSGNFWPSGTQSGTTVAADPAAVAAQQQVNENPQEGTIWDLFNNKDDPNTTVEVNKYIWNASLEILNFLPVQSVDPFTGVIVTGYGVPPGGGRAYRATVYVQDPALDARSLKLALQSRGGAPVSRETARAVEDAILTRARQLRIRDSKL